MTDKIRKDLENAGFVEAWADINLEHGGIFVKDEKHYFDVIRIVDLDSACGADGQVMVEALVTSFDYLSKGQLASVLDCCDSKATLKRIDDKKWRHIALAAMMVEYGMSDPQGYGQSYFVATIDRAAHKEAPEPRESNIKGWGYAAFHRAVRMAIDLC